jgi:uncharacterized protein (TIGR03000 family)
VSDCCGNGHAEEVIEEKDGDKMEKEEEIEEEAKAAAPATIVVTLPADATLTIDGAATKSTSARRVFTSPELPRGKAFTYTLKARFTQDGETRSVTKKVQVRAGQTTEVEMVADAASVAIR